MPSPPDRSTEPRTRGIRALPVDPLVPVVAVVSLVVYALHGFHGALTRDLGIYAYAGQQVADGVPPYLGVLNRAGPLAHVLPGVGVLIARVGGLDEVVTMRVCFMLLATAAVCVSYLLGRDLFRSRAVGLVTAGALLSFHGFVQYASNGPREKTPMTLFILLALWAVVHRRWLAAGVFTSLATLCLQTALFATLPAVVVAALLLAHHGRLRALLRVVIGGALPVAVLVTWFAAVGSLRAAFDGFYWINRTYTVPDPVTDDLDRVWLDLQEAYGVTVWLLLAGCVALALVALAAVSRRARRAEPGLVVLPALLVGLLASLAWIRKEYDAWPDLFPVLPFAAVGLGAAFAVAAHAVAPRLRATVGAALAVTGVALALTYSLTTRDDTLDQQREATEAVLAQLPEGATITSLEAPQPLVLTGRTNPTRHQMFRSGLQDHLEDTWPGGRAGFERDLLDDGPDLVAVGETVSQRWRSSIRPDYVYVGSAPLWDWYARASLGVGTIERLRDAAGFDPTSPLAEPEAPPG
ncbi:hypothetical protein [Nocardioides sp.]|uniref:hypothetical protein n=1 Tax=Nocardioides sp. TaxID=35761 RepID=UPI0035B3D253